jgi:DNA-binding beta-propeller fold protein YncE
LVIFAAAFAGSAIGQAAHLSGVQSTVGASVPTSGSFLGGGLAVDGNGNVYMVDFGGNRVLKETLSAGVYTETTIGSGLNSPFGVAVDASGKVFIADYGNSRVLMETPSGSGYTQTTVQTSSQILPTDVAVDSDGTLYHQHQRIRR